MTRFDALRSKLEVSIISLLLTLFAVLLPKNIAINSTSVRDLPFTLWGETGILRKNHRKSQHEAMYPDITSLSALAISSCQGPQHHV